MRAFSAAAILFVFTLSGETTAQENSKEAVEKWLDWGASSGLSTTYSSIEEDGDRFTITDVVLSYETSFEVPAEEEDIDGFSEPMTINVVFRMPKLVLDDFSIHDDGVEIGAISLPEDWRFTSTFQFEEAGQASIEGLIEDYRIEGVFLPVLPVVEDDPEHLFSRLFPVFRALKTMRVDHWEMDRLAVDFSIIDGGTTYLSAKIEQENVVGTGWANGSITEMLSGESRQEYSYPDENGDLVTDVSTTRETRYEDYHWAALMDILDPQSGVDETLLLGSTVALDTVDVTSTEKTSIGTISLEGLALSRPETDVASFVDAILKGEEIGQTETNKMLFEMLRSVSLERMAIEALSVESSPSTENTADDFPFQAAIGEIHVNEINSGGLGEFSLSEVVFNVTDLAELRFERFFVEDFEFPSAGWSRQLLDSPESLEEADPMLIARAFTPTAISVGLSDFFFRIPDTDDEMVLDGFFTKLESAVPPILTLIEMTVDNFELSTDLIDDPDADAVLGELGIEKIVFNQDIHIDWDESTGDVTIDRLVLDLGRFGKASGRVQIGGVPRFVLENPENPEALMVTANLKWLELDFENAGVVEATVAMWARNDGASENEAKTAILLQLLEALTPFASKEFLSEVEAELSDFLEDPKSFRVTLKPANPLPVAQIAAGYMTSPQTLPQLLGLTIEANH